MKPTREQYEAAFEKERANEYSVIDAFEQRMGFAVDRARLEAAARVLACPVKKNPPNWQHGRVIYSLGRAYLARKGSNATWLDIGTAKGFSACAMSWAIADAGQTGVINSVDDIDPQSREPRNSIDDGKTVEEFVALFRTADATIVFHCVTDTKVYTARIGFAFVDGAHTYEGVKADIAVVTPRQQSGDIILFDDVHLDPVRRAVEETFGYVFEIVTVLPTRQYAIAVKQ
jgi:predicted O-methyltransferase YrrM